MKSRLFTNRILSSSASLRSGSALNHRRNDRNFRGNESNRRQEVLHRLWTSTATAQTCSFSSRTSAPTPSPPPKHNKGLMPSPAQRPAGPADPAEEEQQTGSSSDCWAPLLLIHRWNWDGRTERGRRGEGGAGGQRGRRECSSFWWVHYH